jgi:F0F1-type ATP synthase membrane subunit a
MDLLRMQNSMDEILTLISQATSPQVHGKIAELFHTLFNVSLFFVLFSNRRIQTDVKIN